MSQTENQKLIAFAQAVGTDYKSLSQQLEQLQHALAQLQQGGNIASQIEQAIRTLKNDLMGGELDEQLDTLKELGDRIKALASDNPLSEAILQKFSEINQKVQQLSQQQEADREQLKHLNQTDFLTIYQQAKQG